jgi:hypothetical protein
VRWADEEVADRRLSRSRSKSRGESRASGEEEPGDAKQKARPSMKKRRRAAAWNKKQQPAGPSRSEEPRVVLRSRSEQARATAKVKKWDQVTQAVRPPWAREAQAKASGGHGAPQRRPRVGAEPR